MTVVNVNFYEDSPDAQPAGWNNLDTTVDPTTTGEKIADLLDDGGASTGLSLSVTAAFSGDGEASGGDFPTGDPHGWPDGVWGSYWFTNGTATVRIAGFPANQAVTLETAGHLPNNSTRDTDFNPTGAASQRYELSGTTSPTAPLSFSAQADGSGNLDISATVVSVFGYFNGLTLDYTASSTPNIDNVDTDDTLLDGQSSIEINGTDLGDIDGVNLRDSTDTYVQAQTIDTATATKITLSGALVRGAVPFTSASHTIEIEILDGGVSQDTITVTFNPASGFAVTEVASDTGDAKSLSSVFSDETVANGDQWLAPTATRGGVDLTVRADGTFETDPGSPQPDHLDDVDLWTAAGAGWSGTKDIQVTD